MKIFKSQLKLVHLLVNYSRIIVNGVYCSLEVANIFRFEVALIWKVIFYILKIHTLYMYMRMGASSCNSCFV